MDIGGMLAAGGLIVLFYIGLAAAVLALEIWIAYTIIWKAVRRGLREFNNSPLPGERTVHLHPPKQRGPRDW